jgi:hypothetical protein
MVARFLGESRLAMNRMLSSAPWQDGSGIAKSADEAAFRALADLCHAMFNLNEFLYLVIEEEKRSCLHIHPPRRASLSRRELLMNAGSGFAGLVLTSRFADRDGSFACDFLAEAARSASTGSLDLPTDNRIFQPRQIGDLSVHVRWSQPGRSLDPKPELTRNHTASP